MNLSLATCYHMLGPDLHSTLPALRYAEAAMESAVGDGDEIAWLLELLRRQRTVEEAKERGKELMMEQPLKMPEYTQVV